ncbi:MAG: hypothetical protein HY237_11585 [Acidobacteria bacterium]|nr:hypothetical protein [Acidobacteriota bacterium]
MSVTSTRAESRGFTLVEGALVVVTAFILLAVTVPIIQHTVDAYKLRSAVASATWAIGTTRYQALMKGYPYAVAFDPTSRTYQVSSQPPGAAQFSNVGSAVPLSGSSIVLNRATTLQFLPNGFVQATTGQMNLAISYQGSTKTITVTSYGNVSVN